MNVVVEAELHHVVEVLAAFILVDVAAPDVSFTWKVNLAVDGGLLSVFILFAVDDAVKTVCPAVLALLGHEELGDFDVQGPFLPFARGCVCLFLHIIVFIFFQFSAGNIRLALRNVYAE